MSAFHEDDRFKEALKTIANWVWADDEPDDEKVEDLQGLARFVLAEEPTPAKALERAKAVEECVNICRDFIRRADEADLDSPYTFKRCKAALIKLDALNKEKQDAQTS